MGEGEELWNKYCSFLDKPFSEQLGHNERKLQEYFKRWKQTKMAKQLCPNGLKKFEEVPLTAYEDYSILHKFGEQMERLAKTVPRRGGEIWWDYYLRIGKQVAPILDGWMVEDYEFCSKTSGTTGESKWVAYGKSFGNNFDSILSSLIIACSDCSGDTKLRKGDTFLNITAPPPFASGSWIQFIQDVVKPVPPPEIMDKITDMRKKLWATLKIIEKGQRVDVGGGVASVFHMFSKYFTEPHEFFKEYYQSMNFGIKKFLLFLKYAQCTVTSKKYKRASEMMPVKGMCLGGYDTRLYLDYVSKEFDVTPTSLYGSTEFGVVMYGHVDRKIDYLLDLRDGYFEFLTKKGEVKKIDELKKGQIYDLVGTPFGGMLVRYNIGDQVRVIDFRDDGLPIFDVEGKKEHVIDIYNYFRLTQAMAVKALQRAGLRETDKWCIAKIIEPREHLLLLMEREWKYSEEEGAKLLFQAMLETNPEFQSYVMDFRIKDPLEVIKVEYLKKGAFTKYSMRKVKEGVPIGNIKPVKIVSADKQDILDLLRSV